MTGPVGRRVRSSMRAAVLEYLATSSMARVRPRMPAPDPTYSAGRHRPRSPALLKTSKMSWGYSPPLSMARARGLILSWASRRTVAWSSWSSGESAKSTGEGYRRTPDGNFTILEDADGDGEPASTDSDSSAPDPAGAQGGAAPSADPPPQAGAVGGTDALSSPEGP